MACLDTGNSKEKNKYTREYIYIHKMPSELVKMPELKRNFFVIVWLSEVGYYEYGGMGQVPLSHQAIDAWRRNTRTQLEPEDVNLLIYLSKVYLSQLRKSTDRDEPPPSVVQVTDKVALGNQIKSAFRRLSK